MLVSFGEKNYGLGRVWGERIFYKRHQSRHRMTLSFGDLPEEDWVVLTGGPSWQAVLGARAGAGAGTPAPRELSTAAPTPRPLPPARLPGRR